MDTKSKKKKSETLSKDEDKIKKLKVRGVSLLIVLRSYTQLQSLVLACGVRKVWSKVFQSLDAPAQQIKKLREILHELGMTGRMSMEQAKVIREKREFEQELRECSIQHLYEPFVLSHFF